MNKNDGQELVYITDTGAVLSIDIPIPIWFTIIAKTTCVQTEDTLKEHLAFAKKLIKDGAELVEMDGSNNRYCRWHDTSMERLFEHNAISVFIDCSEDYNNEYYIHLSTDTILKLKKIRIKYGNKVVNVAEYYLDTIYKLGDDTSSILSMIGINNNIPEPALKKLCSGKTTQVFR
jgi:phage anti-repressor protein